MLTLYLNGYIVSSDMFDIKNGKMELGEKIKKLRKKAMLTQIELAKRVGVGLRFIRELEAGKPTVRLDKVNEVLEFFGYKIGIDKR